MDEKKLEIFKASNEYKVVMANFVAIMDLHMNFARETGYSYDEAIEFTKKELNEFINQLDKK